MKYSPIFTGAHAEHEFCIWNLVAFKGRLKQIPVFRHPKKIEDGDTWALFEDLDDYVRISIARSAVTTPISYSMLLLHEMIHQLQYEQGFPLEHDAFFEEQARQIYSITGINAL